MIILTIRNNPYPAGKTIIANRMPREGERASINGNDYYNVIRVCDRWGKDYIYIRCVRGDSINIEGYLEMNQD